MSKGEGGGLLPHGMVEACLLRASRLEKGEEAGQLEPEPELAGWKLLDVH